MKTINQKFIVKVKNIWRFFLLVPVLFLVLGSQLLVIPAGATAGISKLVNFQGKLVNADGTNVADTSYSVVFTLYDADTSGTNLWTETQTVTTSAGIFQVALGSVNTALGSVNFNSDSIYLGIKVGADNEMTPRIRFGAVPYAFNAEKVSGLTVTNTTGTLTIPNAKTISFGDAFTTTGAGPFSLTAASDGYTMAGGLTAGTSRTLTLTAADITLGSTIKPTSAGVLAVQSNGANGLSFDTGGGAAITIGNNNATSIVLGNSTSNPSFSFTGTGGFTVANGGNNNISLGSNAGNGTILIQPNAGGQAALIVNKQGANDIFTASASGSTRFTIAGNGNITSSIYTTSGGVLYTDSTGLFRQTAAGSTATQVLHGGATPAFSAVDLSGDTTGNLPISKGGSKWALDSANGLLSPVNNTLDVIVGGSASNSARFSVLNIAGSLTPIASVSATTATNRPGISISGDGTLQSVNNGMLTIGGGTTGNIVLAPLNGSGNIIFEKGANDVTLGITAPSSARTYTIPDFGSNDSFVGVAANQALTNKSYNGNTVTAGTGTLTLGSNTVSLTGSSKTVTFADAFTTSGAGPFTLTAAADGYTMAGGLTSGTARTLTLTAADITLGSTIKPTNAGTLSVQSNGGNALSLDTGSGAAINIGNANATSLVLGNSTSNPSFSLTGTGGLTVANGGNNNISLGSNAGNGTILIQPNAGGQAALIVNKQGNNDIFTASKSGVTKFVIDTNGNLGIGTASPLATLDVRANSGTLPITNLTGATSFAALAVNNTGVGDLFSASTSGTTKFVVTNAGKVGIGVSIPSVSLDIAQNGVIKLGNAYLSSGGPSFADYGSNGYYNGTSWIIPDNTRKTGMFQFNDEVFNLYQTQTAGGTDFVNRMTILGNGNVGFGNSSPIAPLHLVGAYGNNAAFIVNNTNNGNLIAASSSGTTKFTVDTNGNITTGAWQATRVGALYGGTNIDTSGSTGVPSISGGTWSVNSILPISLGGTNNSSAFTAGSVIFSDGSKLTQDNTKLFYDDANNRLGIGTSAPFAALDVRASSNTTPAASVSANSTFAALIVNNSGSGDFITASAAGLTKFAINNSGTITTASVGTGSLKTATGSTTCAAATDCNATANDYSFSPSFTDTSTGASNRYAHLITAQENVADPNNTTARWQFCGSTVCTYTASFAAGSGPNSNGIATARWRYITASDHPTIWAVVNADGTMTTSVWEAEDPANQIAYPENPNPLEGTNLKEGQYFLSPAPLTVDNLKALYAKFPASDTAEIITKLREYIVDQRHWLESFTSLDDINSISDRYQPAAREWAFRYLATHYNQSIAGAIMLFLKVDNGILVSVDDPQGALDSYNQDLAGMKKEAQTAPVLSDQHGADIAEWYHQQASDIEPGDVVTIAATASAAVVIKSQTAYDPKVLGIISTSPGQVLGDKQSSTDVQLALTGRVPAKVSTQNGPIHTGDSLTTSSIPGVAMKATKAGQVIGKALEDYTSTDRNAIGKILVFVNLTYAVPDVNIATLLGHGLEDTANSDYGQALLSALIAQKALGNTENHSDMSVDRVIAGLEIVTPKVTTDALQVNTITPATGKDIAFQLSDEGKISVKIASNEAGIVFTGKGDAFFAGTITADKLHVNQIELSVDAWNQALKDGGLKTVESRILNQESRIANLENLFASQSATPTVRMAGDSATIQASVEADLLVHDTTPTGALKMKGLFVDGLASVAGELKVEKFQVTGSALVEGILHVVDFITTKNLIVDQLATFLGNVVFSGDVHFEGRPTFNSDTAGIAVIKKGNDRVEVQFKKEYESTPLVQASIVVNDVSPIPNEDIANLLKRQETQEQQVLGSNARYIVTKRTPKSFTILLAKPAVEETTFSWLVIAVDKPIAQNDTVQSYQLQQLPERKISEPIISVTPNIPPPSRIGKPEQGILPSPPEAGERKEVEKNDNN